MEQAVNHFMPQKNVIIIIDAGHGSLLNGKYTTDPKTGKWYDHKDKSLNFHGIKGNSIYYEGVGNRILANTLGAFLTARGYTVLYSYDEVKDTSLADRGKFCDQINAAAKLVGKKVIIIPVHSNATIGGKGLEVITSVGKTVSDTLAERIYTALTPFAKEYGIVLRTDRSDGDSDKERNLAMTADVVAPSAFLELCFFDNLQEAKLLDLPQFQSAMMYAVALGIMTFIKNDFQ